MECTLAFFLSCFSWSNLYLDGGFIYDDISYVEINPTTLEVASAPRNPFGRAAIGYEMRFKGLTLSLEASHVSSLNTNADRGVNAISVQARWYPFSRAE
jgi:hypothetical protein